MDALMTHLRNCEKLSRRYPEFPKYREDAEDVAEIIKEILAGWKD